MVRQNASPEGQTLSRRIPRRAFFPSASGRLLGLSASPVYNPPSIEGQVAQLVEQRTENPRVGSSILPLAIPPVTLPSWAFAVLAYHLASRLAYVFWVGATLRRQERRGNRVFAWFRRRAAILMNNDAASFVLLCVVTGQTLELPVAASARIAAGAALILIGVGVKLWAAQTLGWDAYYWRNFFTPDDRDGPVTSGPYRFLRNPMYTVGNLHLYGLALTFASVPALAASVLDHAAILLFYVLVERPHFLRVVSRER